MQLGTDAYYMTKVPQAFLYEKDGTVADEGFSSGFLKRLKGAPPLIPGSPCRHTTGTAGI